MKPSHELILAWFSNKEYVIAMLIGVVLCMKKLKTRKLKMFILLTNF